MLLSRTNNSLQQRISSSDSSSLIGLRCNPECNARAKANSYKVGNCFSCSSDESASVDAGDPSIPMPNSFKPSPRSSFKVSNVPLSNGCANDNWTCCESSSWLPRKRGRLVKRKHSQTHWHQIIHNGCESTLTVTTCKR
jgi:hypothetical protein